LATSPTKYYYALDGRGRLYAITASNTVRVFNIDGTSAGTATVPDAASVLGLADRALVKTSPSTGSPPFDVHEITTTGSAAGGVNRGTVLYNAVNKCTVQALSGDRTRDINGAGTNFIRCVYGDPNIEVVSLTYDSGSGLYGIAERTVASGTLGIVRWASNKALVSLTVSSTTTVYLCTTTTTPSISCSSTDLPGLNTNIIGTGTGKYLKSNGDDVFYITSSGALKVGNIFDPPSSLPITVSSATGGNASFDLTRFAFTFRPPTAPPECNTQIAYLPSPNGPEKRYTLDRANTCVSRILKVY